MSDDLLAILRERSRDRELMTWYRFVLVMHKLTQRMDAMLQQLDISRSQFELLMLLALEQGINQRTCAERLNVTKGNITQHIDRLAGQGLIRRHKVGRTNRIYLTEVGETLVAEIMPVHDQTVHKILSPLSAEDMKHFQAILRKLDGNLD